MTNANLAEVREEGFRALVKGPGTAETVDFLRQFEGGGGDYTKERGELLDGITIDEIAQRIRERKNPR